MSVALIEEDRITKKAEELGLSESGVKAIERWLGKGSTRADVASAVRRDVNGLWNLRFGMMVKLEVMRWSGALTSCPCCGRPL